MVSFSVVRGRTWLAGFLFAALLGAFFLAHPARAGMEITDPKSSNPAVVDEIIASFESGCGLGPWTKAALKRSSDMTAIFRSLRRKAECTGIETSIGMSAALEAELQDILTDEVYSQERQYEEATQDLLLAMQTTNDPSLKASLGSSYVTTRYQLALTRAKANAKLHPDRAQRIQFGMSRVARHVQGLMSEMNAMASCYANNPTAAIQLGAGLLDLGGSFASPAIGLGIKTAASLISTTVQFARTFPAAQQEYKTRKSRMSTALTCGLEALTRDYCKARDARTLVNLKRDDQDLSLLPFFYGIDLLDRRLPALNEWLDRVRNGIIPTDPDQAKKINDQFKKVNDALAMKRTSDAIYSEAEKKISAESGTPEKLKLLQKLILDLTVNFYVCAKYSGNQTNCVSEEPLFEGYETGFSLAKKIIGTEAPWNPQESLLSYITRNVTSVDLMTAIPGNATAVFNSRYKTLEREFKEKVNVDSGSLVRAASNEDIDRISAVSTMRRLLEFFRNYAYSDGPIGEQDRMLIGELSEKLSAIADRLEDPGATSGTPARGEMLSPADKLLTDIHEAFKLQNNNIYLPGRVTQLIFNDLKNRLKRGEGPKEIKDILDLAGRDVATILRQNHMDSPLAIKEDITGAQSDLTAQLDQFRSFFAKNIGWALEDKLALAKKLNEPGFGDERAVNRNAAAKLCILTLLTGIEWPSKIDKSLCRGALVKSDDAKLVLRFDELDAKFNGPDRNKPFDDRVCYYEELYRADRLAFRKGAPRLTRIARPDDFETQLWQAYLDQL